MRSRLHFVRLAGFVLIFSGTAQIARPQAAQDGGDFSTNSAAKKLPTDVIMVKGAWASASDAVTPLPEGGVLADGRYTNKYFRLAYTLPRDWMQKYSGPPPSDSGYYVLGQFRPADTSKGASQGTILVAAQDLFFALTPAANAFELIHESTQNLMADYKAERAPTPVSIAGHSFVRFDYFSPAAELHWYVLTTEIRCHAVKFVFTGHDSRWMESLIEEMNRMQLPAEASPISGNGGEDVPVCIKDYARENLLEKVDPVFTERRFNPIPVRIIVGKDGKVKHIHFLSAFPDQGKSITDALWQWRFKPYSREGQPVEVETGMLFGRAPRMVNTATARLTSQ
ncbi:MAG TPA: hypothetical protein VE077_22310 [Candidatus Methylomirabilis sp.]|nr:hypothetical protein [Candidatus Methylomirabilis sp.]